MSSEAPAVNLRPMSVGEMLDRGFTVYLRNVLVLTGALVVVIVPTMLLQYLASRDMLGFDISMMTSAFKNPNAPPPQPDVSQFTSAYVRSLPLMGLSMLLSVIALPFANAAVIAGVSRSYLGERISLAECYRDAFRRWAHVLLLAVLWIVAFLVGYFAFVILLVLLTFVFAAIIAAGAHMPAALAVAGAIVVFPLIIWFVLTAQQLYMTWALSFAAVVVESVDPIKAFASGFARVFSRGAYWRSFGVAAAITGVIIALELIVGGLGTAIYVVFKPTPDVLAPLFYGALTLMTVIYTPLMFAIVAMYYYDARIRREGFDLEHLARQLAGGGAAQPIAGA
ncbi:MAG TPA: hypothetical protein VKT51_08440 [Candidatus Eremiobacteraceae bacterium]|nr:hypothetical protein [Candidatus Eremiobacteraceae bacterium]